MEGNISRNSFNLATLKWVEIHYSLFVTDTTGWSNCRICHFHEDIFTCSGLRETSFHKLPMLPAFLVSLEGG